MKDSSTLLREQITNTYNKYFYTLYFIIVTLLNNKLLSIIHWFCYFYFTSAGSISDMVLLIASHRFLLVLYCQLHKYNFIYTSDHRFSIEFGSRLDGSHSIIFSPVNLLRLKNSRATLCIWEGASLWINTRFTLKLRDCDLYHVQKILSIKSQ